METKKYVVGFAFSEDRENVLLIEKLKPEWQNGCLNGIGGKIEHGEGPKDAMKRECAEECGLDLPWKLKGRMKGTNNDGSSFECYIFYAYTDMIYAYKQIEQERLSVYNIYDLAVVKKVTNLNYLIPYGAHNDGSNYLEISY